MATLTTTAKRPASIGKGWAFRSIWTKTLREYRTPVIAWGLILALSTMVTAAATPSAKTAADQSALNQLVQNFRFFGEPVAITTPMGYLTWKLLGTLPAMLGIWAVLAGARLTRGEEERGSAELLLGQPVSRVRLLIGKVVALILALTIIGLLIGVAIALGAAQAKISLGLGPALLAGLNITLATLVFGLAALFFSQFTRTAGAAAGIAGAYLGVDYALAGAARSVNGLDGLGRVTVNYYYGLSKPLIPSYGTNPGALLVMLAMCAVLGGLSLWLFVRRDLGDVAHLLPQSVSAAAIKRANVRAVTALPAAQRNVTLRTVAARGLAAQGASIGWWALGVGVWAFYGTYITKSTLDTVAQAYASNPAISRLFKGTNLATNAGFLTVVLMTYLPFLIVFAATFFAMNWANDLERGRVETTLSAPLPRWRIPVERFLAPLVGIVALLLAVWLPASVGASLSGLSIDNGQLFLATLAIWPMALLTATLVYALAGRMPSGAVLGVVGGLVALSFLVTFLGPLLNIPDWLAKFSIFTSYGQPLVHGVNWTAFWVMLAVSAVFFVVGFLQFSRADVRN